MCFRILIALLGSIVTAIAADSKDEAFFREKVRPALMDHCYDCHEPGDSKGGVEFLGAEKPADISKMRHTWHSVAAQLRNRTMPPEDKPQPSEVDRIKISDWIDQWLRITACESGDFAGSVTTRRLNRRQYNNTIRDLLGLDLKFSETFPADSGGGEGFNNNGETLFLPAMLMERYLESAQVILDAAIESPLLVREFGPGDFQPSAKVNVRLPRRITAGAKLSALIVIHTPGSYTVKVDLVRDENQDARLAFKVDDITAHRFRMKSVKNAEDGKSAAVLETKIKFARGPHVLSFHGMEGSGPAGITKLVVAEGKRGRSKQQHEAHRRIFAPGKLTGNEDSEARRVAANHIVSEFAAGAFRRPLEAGELDRFMALYDRAAGRGDPFEESVKLALKAVLVSPHFLFMVEQDHAEPGIHRITDRELAVRLSYFLWASAPDAELHSLAAAGKLRDPNVLAAQTKRMLSDPRSREFVEDFMGQWLGTEDVGGRVAPVNGQFRDVYSSELAADFREEAVQLMQFILKDDRSLLELIDADYAFVTQRLAKHYEIPNVKGNHFRKVPITNGQRGGILGLGGVHMVTSLPQRTSPVLRGAWVLETMLGTPVPPPPPGIPALQKVSKKKGAKTIRETLESHRKNPTCAACHDLIDAIGFGLENYDLLGQWRTKENGKPVDASGVMPSGEKFSGPSELKQVLLDRKTEFARHLSGKFLGYALGRSLEENDDCSIERLVQELERSDYSAQALIRAVVFSVPFQNRQGLDAESGE